MRFQLYPLSRAFSNRYVFDENAQRFSVDRRPKRIEMYAFSNENALVLAKIGRYFARLSRITVLLFNTYIDNKAQVYSRKAGGNLYLSKIETGNIFPPADVHE